MVVDLVAVVVDLLGKHLSLSQQREIDLRPREEERKYIGEIMVGLGFGPG